MSFYFFWLQCITWSCRLLTLVTVGQRLLAFNYSIFYFSLAAGCILFAWWIDRGKTSSVRQIRGMALASTFIASIMTFATRFANGYGISVAFSVSGFAAGIIVPLLQRFMISQIPQNKRGKAFGCAIGTALFVNFVLFILLVPAAGDAAIYTRAYADSQACLASVIFLITGLTAAVLCGIKAQPTQAICDYSTPDTIQGNRALIMPRFIVLFFLVCLFFYLSIGIQDHVIALSWFAGGNTMFLTRIFSVIGAFAAGILCDRKGRHVLIVSSMVLLAAGIVSTMLAYHGALAFISLSLVQFAYMAFDISIKLMMTDMSLYSKKPVLIASMGFSFPYIMRQSGAILGSSLTAHGLVPVFVTLVLLLILPSPFLTMLFDEIRNMYLFRLKTYSHRRQQTPLKENAEICETSPRLSDDLKNCNSSMNYEELIISISNRCSLTPRETEVLHLVLLGQTIKEMAQNLYISEVTIKTHIGRILKKTGAKNRTHLFSIIMNTPDNVGNNIGDFVSASSISSTTGINGEK